MALVAYSDSEESDTEAPPAPKPAARQAPKPSFQKVVDRSNPGRIKVNLPSTKPQADVKNADNEDRPAKKARTDGGAFSGFNSMLPAPKKANAVAAPAPGKDDEVSTTGGKKIFGGAFKPGVSFTMKTSARPTFVRDSEDIMDYSTTPTEPKSAATEPVAPPKSVEPPAATKPEPASKALGSLRFVPLSVARARKQKKQTAGPPSTWTTTTAGVKHKAPVTPAKEQKPAEKPKMSLFSLSTEDSAEPVKPVSDGQYQPLLYGTREDDDAKLPDEAFDNDQANGHTTATSSAPAAPETLDGIASSLNLSEAERRQLFGRKRGGPDLSTANIVEFNTDAEYAHNEKLRASGETIQHNALRSITGTGKNSLRSLVNTATTQKEALEEHFAQGRRNKKEAGNKYGW